MEYTFKNLDDAGGISDDIVSRYNELIVQLKGKASDIGVTDLEEVRKRKDSELLLFMCDSATSIMGMAHVSYLCVPVKKVGYINTVVVDKKYRGHGLGGLLMEELQKRACQRWPNINTFNLTSNPLKGTQGFYLRLGYRMRTKEAGDETIFYVKDVDGYKRS